MQENRKTHIIAVGLLVLGLSNGCSTQTKTVTTETREYPSNATVENRTETTTTETRGESAAC